LPKAIVNKPDHTHGSYVIAARSYLDFVRTIDIHKQSGLRALLNIIPIDTGMVRGSHG
jgi:hypothetical protein